MAGPVSYQHIVRHDPNYSIFVATVDLASPAVKVRVSRGGPDPDGDGPWLTTLLPTSEVAQREHFDIAVNGDFFIAQDTHDIEGRKTGYVRGKFAAPEGLAMTDGQLWSVSTNGHPYFEITARGLGEIREGKIDRRARQVVSGRQVIVRRGRRVNLTSKFATIKNPRTAVGLNKDGTKMILAVVDGRQPALSVGMTLGELADQMIRLGCYTALNLDGGGSSTMVWHDPKSNRLVIVNSPSDTKERSVADVLGVTVAGPLPPLAN